MGFSQDRKKKQKTLHGEYLILEPCVMGSRNQGLHGGGKGSTVG